MALPRGLVWITGASSGIGWAAAQIMARRGWDVAASARNEPALKALAERHEAIHPYPLDVADPVAREDVYHRIREDLGPVDVLVNNAGYAVRGAVEEVPMHEVREIFDVNVYAPLALSRLVLPEMRARREGRIVMVSSVVGRVAFPIGGIYASTKYALEGLADGLRMEVNPWGIKVSIVEPGPISTHFGAVAKDRSLARLHDESSPYSPYYRKFLSSSYFSRSQIWPASSVGDAIRRAAEDEKPKARYPVHPVAHWLPPLAMLLPTSWIDWVLGVRFGLNKPAKWQ